MRFVIPAKKQPKVFDAIKAGYDTLSGHIYLLLFPILLDIFYLFGKRLLVSDQIERMVGSVNLPSSATTEVIKSWEELSTTFLISLKTLADCFLAKLSNRSPKPVGYRPLESNPLGDFTEARFFRMAVQCSTSWSSRL
jgi:hypothetical protein